MRFALVGKINDSDWLVFSGLSSHWLNHGSFSVLGLKLKGKHLGKLDLDKKIRLVF